jgi:4-hydroxy-3-polyprenylbenzoate decarboxylase
MPHLLQDVIADLEKHGHLIRIKEEVDPYLEMAAIHLRINQANGPAILFEKVKGSKYPAVSNLFGNVARSKFIFRNTLKDVEEVIKLKYNPIAAIKNPFKHIKSAFAGFKALPLKQRFPEAEFDEIHISDLPMIHHWEMDGGAFITLPQVYSEDPEKPGIMNANVGMYRVQLSGNEYEINKEIGLHYQTHRGIGVHQAKATAKGEPLKVSIFVGGHPAHTIAAVMPLPEGLSEVLFAGMLAGRRFRYSYKDGYCISNDADFVITGEILPYTTKPEGPFGDHLGYYSLVHDFPVMKIHKVYARKNAIWNFTVVGRPPQEDTAFGDFIHEITGDAIPTEIKGIKEVHAVDAAGVHPLLLAVASERYTPYAKINRPQEILTLANHILGYGQLSLAKYLFITAEQGITLNTRDEAHFFQYILERIDLSRDLHFQTNTTIDTLDYSGEGLNKGSKVIIAAYGDPIRSLCQTIPSALLQSSIITDFKLVMPGVVVAKAPSFTDYHQAQQMFESFSEEMLRITDGKGIHNLPMLIIADNPAFVVEDIKNFLWITFTRSNPSHDIYGIGSYVKYKHWGCKSTLIIDARIKPFHAPPLIPNPDIERKVDALFQPGGSLYGVI